MKTEILNVNGMNCAHCEKAVMDVVAELDGVAEVKAIEEEGFEVV